MGPSTALRACGRCRTTVVTGPSCSTRTGSELSLAMAATLAARSAPGPDGAATYVRKAECRERRQLTDTGRHDEQVSGTARDGGPRAGQGRTGVGGRRARRAVHGDERAGAARRRATRSRRRAPTRTRRRSRSPPATRPAPPDWPSPSSSSAAASPSSPSAPPVASASSRHKYAAEPEPRRRTSRSPWASASWPDPAERPGPRRDPGRWPGGGGGISNPRWACTHTRFRGVLLRPLGHATAGEGTRAAAGRLKSRSTTVSGDVGPCAELGVRPASVAAQAVDVDARAGRAGESADIGRLGLARWSQHSAGRGLAGRVGCRLTGRPSR